MPPSVTLKKIAEITGFSIITVSRALTNPDLVKEKTREKILATCKEMNYTPNMAAKSLRDNRTRMIAVYIPEDIRARNPFYSEFVSSVAEALGDHRYSMCVTKTLDINYKCDGLILTGLSEKDFDKSHELSNRLPTVLFGHIDGVDSIDVDNKEGLSFITAKVIERGAKNILYLSINQDRIFVKDRELGMSEVCIKKGIPYSIERVNNNQTDSYLFLKNNFKKFSNVDTIVCASDDIALGAINYLSENNINIPNDIQVSGFDGFGSECHSVPEIATMRQPIFEIGQLLVERLINKIENGINTTECRLIKPLFIDNDSIKKGDI